jgi:SAM-dependent methyltransferase
MNPDILSQSKNVSVIEKLKIYAYILKLSIKKQKRDYTLIDQEYNSGIWNREFEKIDFESLDGNFKRKDAGNYVIMSYNDKLIKYVRREIENEYYSQILDVLKEFKEDPIVELGCGLGSNLFVLRKAGFKKLAGCDLSENVIKNLSQYSNIKQYDMVFNVCDLNNSFPKDMLRNKIVFSHICLEQCKNIMPNVLNNIIEAKPKLVINFEVNYNTSPYVVKKYLDARDYQNNLVTELEKFQKQKRISIISITKLPLNLNSVNRLSSIIWKVNN